MAKQVIGASVEVEFQSVGNLRKAIKEANSELLKTQQAFGVTSKEAFAAAKRVNELKDAIKDANEVADLFDPGNKFKAVGNAVTALASGFTAVQGALGLLGVESKEVEKQLLRVQSALALSQGLSGILDSQKDFVRLASIIKTQVVAAFTTLRGAIIATGIGALAVGIGLLVANFDSVKKAVLNLFPGLGKLASFLGDIFEKFTDFIGITSEAERQLESFRAAVLKSNQALDSQIAILEAQDGKEAQVYELKKKRIQDQRNALTNFNKDLEKLNDEQITELVRLNTEAAVLDIQEQKRKSEAAKKDAEERKKRGQEAKKEREEAEKKRLQEFEEDQKRRIDLFNRQIENIRDQRKKREELEAEEAEKKKATLTRDTERQTNAIQQIIDARERLNQKNQEDLQLEQARTNIRLQLQNQIGAGIGALADLVGRQTALGKTLAIAEIALGTATGFIQGLDIAQKGAKATGPAAPFAFPIFYATQIAAVLGAASRAKAVLSKVPGGSSGGSFSAPQIKTTAPLTPQLSVQAQASAQNAAAINNLQQNPTRAYILDRDIQNQNQINSFITRNANI